MGPEHRAVPGSGGPFAHTPVLADEVVALLAPAPEGTVIDVTVGGGGHAAAILDAHRHLSLLGLDRDPAAVAAAGDRLAGYGDRVRIIHARSDQLIDFAGDLETPVVGVLADLGVSSTQLDQAKRGFSYRGDRDGPVDMRMDPGDARTAGDLLATTPVDELARLLADLGDVPTAGRVARALVAARPFASTAELARVARDAVPAAVRRRGDPAKQVFQALRIAVNDEIDLLGRLLDDALDVLGRNGRLVVISYHSGEDRLVKQRLRAAASGGCVCPPELPCVCGARARVEVLRPALRRPDVTEAEVNPRAASARLRAARRLGPDEAR